MTKKKLHRVDAPEVADQARRGSSPLYPVLPKMPPSADRRPTTSERLSALAEERANSKRQSSKGGIIVAEKKRYDAWKEWREDVMKECKQMLRADPNIKRADVLKRLREDLNPNCSARTLERTIDDWKKKAQRFRLKLRR